jgi:hypothetical protein
VPIVTYQGHAVGRRARRVRVAIRRVAGAVGGFKRLAIADALAAIVAQMKVSKDRGVAQLARWRRP